VVQGIDLTGENSSGAPQEAENKGPVTEAAPPTVGSSSSSVVGSNKPQTIPYTVKSKSEEPNISNIALIILFLVVAAAVIYMRGGQTTSLNAPGLNQGTLPPQIIPTTTLTVRKYDITLPSCLELKSSGSLEAVDCFTELALKEKNVEVCNALDNKNITYNPRDPCIRHYAMKADPSRCSVYPNNTILGHDCYLELALSYNVSSQCNHLEEGNLKLRSLCVLSYVFFRSPAYYALSNLPPVNNPALTTTLCPKIEDANLRTYCFALATTDSRYCESISTTTREGNKLKEKCQNCANHKWKECRILLDSEKNAIKL
jgi:hypothetical protein